MKPVPLRYVADSIQTGPFGSQLHAEDYTPGGTPVVNPAHIQDGRIVPDLDCAVDEETFARLSRHALGPGDVVLGRRGELGRSAVVRPEQAGWLCGTGSIRVRANAEKLDPRWLQCVLSSDAARDWLSLESVGSTMENLGAGIVGSLPIPLPSLDRQRELLGALDSAKNQVDLVVVAKQRLLHLLAEKRKAIIATAVTRGLDPKAKLRDSSVPWLGEIPAHWDMTRLKFVARVQTGIALGKDYAGQATSELPYLRVANVQDGFIDLSEVKTMAVPEREAASATLRRGDVLMNEGGDADKLGRGAIWDASINPCLHQNHVFALRPMSVSSEWLSTWTGSEFAKAYFETKAKQSTNLASISSTNLLELPIAVPPDGEQHAIVERIARETTKLDAVRAATERTIALLKERRAALIATAVTGQLEVMCERSGTGGA